LAEQRVARPDRPNGTAPSLLTGLLHDAAGDRLVPSHAVKAGKRYRYYISSHLVTGSRSDNSNGIRVPSAELETGVIERIAQFLADRSALFEALQPIEPDLRRLQQQTARAAEIAEGLGRASRPELAAMLPTLVGRVTVREAGSRSPLQPRCSLCSEARLRPTSPPQPIVSLIANSPCS
jgi:site-specific DNA recombinase